MPRQSATCWTVTALMLIYKAARTTQICIQQYRTLLLPLQPYLTIVGDTVTDAFDEIRRISEG